MSERPCLSFSKLLQTTVGLIKGFLSIKKIVSLFFLLSQWHSGQRTWAYNFKYKSIWIMMLKTSILYITLV
uniref:Uncharacterized protein n=1 Tax=Anguilla anguilla TaxID=7936 RepID=A0A0E9QJG6_ANGAN